MENKMENEMLHLGCYSEAIQKLKLSYQNIGFRVSGTKTKNHRYLLYTHVVVASYKFLNGNPVKGAGGSDPYKIPTSFLVLQDLKYIHAPTPLFKCHEPEEQQGNITKFRSPRDEVFISRQRKWGVPNCALYASLSSATV